MSSWDHLAQLYGLLNLAPHVVHLEESVPAKILQKKNVNILII